MPCPALDWLTSYSLSYLMDYWCSNTLYSLLSVNPLNWSLTILQNHMYLLQRPKQLHSLSANTQVYINVIVQNSQRVVQRHLSSFQTISRSIPVPLYRSAISTTTPPSLHIYSVEQIEWTVHGIPHCTTLRGILSLLISGSHCRVSCKQDFVLEVHLVIIWWSKFVLEVHLGGLKGTDVREVWILP